MMARGFRALLSVLLFLSAAILGLAWAVELDGCAAFQPQFRMVDPEIVSDPKFGECARSGTTLSAGHTQFAMLASVCVQRTGDAGVMLDPPVEMAMPKDAGAPNAEETDQ